MILTKKWHNYCNEL